MIPLSIEAIYEDHRLKHTAITYHLPRLRHLAEGLGEVREFGVKRGASSSALLLGARHVTSFDIVPTTCAHRLAQAAGPKWDYRIESSLVAAPAACDLLFIDSLHTFAQCHAELIRHASSVRKYLAFHDTVTFGSIGAADESGRQSWTYMVGEEVPLAHLGIRHAIDLLMIRDASWRLVDAEYRSHGLLILERR